MQARVQTVENMRSNCSRTYVPFGTTLYLFEACREVHRREASQGFVSFSKSFRCGSGRAQIMARCILYSFCIITSTFQFDFKTSGNCHVLNKPQGWTRTMHEIRNRCGLQGRRMLAAFFQVQYKVKRFRHCGSISTQTVQATDRCSLNNFPKPDLIDTVPAHRSCVIPLLDRPAAEQETRLQTRSKAWLKLC